MPDDIAETTQVPTTEPEVNPVTNTVIVPFADIPESIQPTPEKVPVETPEEPTVTPTDPFASETPREPSLSQQETANLRKQQVEIEKGRAELERDQAGVKQTREVQDRLARYTTQYGEQAAREMVQDQMADKAKYDTELAEVRKDQKFLEDKQQGITELSKQYNVDPAFLAKFGSRDSMEAGAIERSARIQDRTEATKVQEAFEKRLTAMEAGKVEDGPFDSASTGSTPLTGDALVRAAADLDFYEKMTPKQKEDVTATLKV